MRLHLLAWSALAFVALAGVPQSAQSAQSAEIAERCGSPFETSADPAIAVDETSTGYVQGLIENGPLIASNRRDRRAVGRALQDVRLWIGSSADGEPTEAERALLEPKNRVEMARVREALRDQLQDPLVERKLIAYGALDTVLNHASLTLLRCAVRTYRKAAASTALGVLTAEEIADLKKAEETFDSFAGFETVTHPGRDELVVLPLGVVSRNEAAQSDASWLTYESADRKIALDYFSNPSRQTTPNSLAAQLLERKKDLSFQYLDLTGDDFVIEAAHSLGAERQSLITQGRQRKGYVIGHGFRVPIDPPSGLTLPDMKIFALNAQALPFRVKAEDTDAQRNWRVVVKTLSNLLASRIEEVDQWSYLPTSSCKGVVPDRARLRNKVNIIYATGRKPLPNATDKKTELGNLYGTELDEKLHLGCIQVSVSDANKSSQIMPRSRRMDASMAQAAPAAQSPPFEVSIPQKPVEIDLAARGRASFKASERIVTNATPRVLLYIHGYNTSFEEAVKRAAQIAAAGNYTGYVYVFSWPSQSSAFNYAGDMDYAEQAEPDLAYFMRMILMPGLPLKLDVIVHSMGSQVLLRSIDGIRSAFDGRVGLERSDRVRLGQVIFASPDVSELVFKRKITQIQPFADRITVYASANDGVIDASGWLRENIRRTGLIDDDGQPVYADNVHFIDVTGEKMPKYLLARYLCFTHSAFAYDEGVLEDIADSLKQAGIDQLSRITPIARAEKAKRTDKFTEASYTSDPTKKFWKLNVKREKTVKERAEDAYKCLVSR